MKLRPHHILCIGKFTGHGYDERFTRHMTEIVSQLRNDPETGITLVCGPDELCSYCPNDCGGICTSQEKVASIDADVLKVCGLYEGDAVWSKLTEAARRSVFEADAFESICSRCEWFTLCMNTATDYQRKADKIQ